MHYSIADQDREQSSPQPKAWDYVDPRKVTVLTARPKWTWVARVCHEIPVGKCVLFELPKGEAMDRFINNMRSSLSVSCVSNMDKFSIRRSKCGSYVVVMKSGVWSGLYRFMESGSYAEADAEIAERNRRASA